MIEYDMRSDYELIAKHCPKCESLVLAQIVRTMEGEFYKYREMKCSQCEWKSPGSC